MPNKIEFLVDGKVYTSPVQAAKELGVSTATVYHRIKQRIYPRIGDSTADKTILYTDYVEALKSRSTDQ